MISCTKAHVHHTDLFIYRTLEEITSALKFNPDPIKQAIEFCFSHKGDKEVYPSLKFNNNDVQSAANSKSI